MKPTCQSKYSAIILFAICLIMEIPLWAQQKAIQGSVKDMEGNPMPGVTMAVIYHPTLSRVGITYVYN